jgi:hypothetical protein
MSRETLLTDEDGTKYSYENIKTQGWLIGHTSGLDAAINYLKDRAVELFRDGKDDAAIGCRRLAEAMDKALRPDMERNSKRHEKEFPAIVVEEE